MLSSPAIFLFLLAADPPSQVGAPGDPLHPWEWVSLVPWILAGLQSLPCSEHRQSLPLVHVGSFSLPPHRCPGSVMPKMMPTQLRVLHSPRRSRTCLQEEEAAPSAGLGACPPCGNGCRKRRGQPGVGGWARWLVTSSSSNAAASNPRSLKHCSPHPSEKKLCAIGVQCSLCNVICFTSMHPLLTNELNTHSLRTRFKFAPFLLTFTSEGSF